MQQYRRLTEETEASSAHSQSQIDHWRQSCKSLTSLVEEKDMELRSACAARQEAEDNVALLEAQKRTLDLQVSILN